jgi:Na+-transporting methylmalonyl-CoA/oxaloacetate decarboxylase gamma subunit
MLKFLLIIFIIIYIIYKISTFYVSFFIKKSVNNFKKESKSKNKGILKDEGDFIDYEEVD